MLFKTKRTSSTLPGNSLHESTKMKRSMATPRLVADSGRDENQQTKYLLPVHHKPINKSSELG